MNQSRTIIELRDVSKHYGQEDSPNYLEVLKGINLTIKAGESLAVVGPSGCGKSTLLNILGALDQADSGSILFNGDDIARKTEGELAVIRNQNIGFVFQNHHLLPQCTVLENVLMPTLAAPKNKDNDAAARARQLLDRVNLQGRHQHRPGELSGGERQRVAVVRALINQPELLLADEPTGSLDHVAAAALGDLLMDLNRESGVTLILVTHSDDLAARAGRTCRLQDGQLLKVDLH